MRACRTGHHGLRPGPGPGLRPEQAGRLCQRPDGVLLETGPAVERISSASATSACAPGTRPRAWTAASAVTVSTSSSMASRMGASRSPPRPVSYGLVDDAEQLGRRTHGGEDGRRAPHPVERGGDLEGRSRRALQPLEGGNRAGARRRRWWGEHARSMVWGSARCLRRPRAHPPGVSSVMLTVVRSRAKVRGQAVFEPRQRPRHRFEQRLDIDRGGLVDEVDRVRD